MGTLIIISVSLVALVAYFVHRRSKRNVPKPFPVDFTVSSEGEDDDTWEGGMWEARDPRRVTAKLQIEYCDAVGNKTTRNVNVREFDNKLYHGVFMGICELRNAHRTFRFDRILSCIDLETGEVISDVRRHLNDKYESSPDRSRDLLLSDYLDALKAICFVAKADGQFRAAEKEVVVRYVRTLVRDDRITLAIVDQALKTVPIPSLQAFKLTVGRIIKGGQVDPDLLNTCCKQIVATQKSVHPAEQEALDYIERKLTERRASYLTSA